MPHVVVLYTSNLEPLADIGQLCRSIRTELLSIRDERGEQPYPTAGTRVLAQSQTHFAVADGSEADDYGFIYINVRMAKGRSEAIKEATGARLTRCVERELAVLLAVKPVGITLQMDESPGQVFDAKFGSLRAHLAAKATKHA